ncbi:hypothetical protein BCR39DRAFT_531841 [Naematelia encephala]|uniref:Uncharacterized protein n=1 Tax=Naematelia encephala TaxID=71784 RepID=A0A1Y2B3U8_9TREE|nr:hypothetical protein BCR39DRAFT_531841 [Naematelia encephala]
MPDDSLPSQYELLGQINFTGGFPVTSDLAPSIVFLIVYVISVLLLVFRLIRKQDRSRLLIRPSIFVACRIGMLVLRAIMSKTTYGEGELIAELVLVSIGYLFLIEPIIGLWKLHLASAVTQEAYPTYVNSLARVLRLLLIAAIATAIAGSSLISSALNDSSELSTVRQLRQASAILSMVTVVITALSVIVTHVHFSLDARRTVYLLIVAACLIITGVYRVVQVYNHDMTAPVQSKAAFWILQILFEFIAYCLLIAISIPTHFPGAPKEPEGHQLNDVESGRNKA